MQSQNSYTFAKKVVEEYLNSHRGLNFDIPLLKGITKAYLIRVFLTNQNRWNSFKAMIKRLEKGYLVDVQNEQKGIYTDPIDVLLEIFASKKTPIYVNKLKVELSYHEYKLYRAKPELFYEFLMNS